MTVYYNNDPPYTTPPQASLVTVVQPLCSADPTESEHGLRLQVSMHAYKTACNAQGFISYMGPIQLELHYYNYSAYSIPGSIGSF